MLEYSSGPAFTSKTCLEIIAVLRPERGCSPPVLCRLVTGLPYPRSNFIVNLGEGGWLQMMHEAPWRRNAIWLLVTRSSVGPSSAIALRRVSKSRAESSLPVKNSAAVVMRRAHDAGQRH